MKLWNFERKFKKNRYYLFIYIFIHIVKYCLDKDHYHRNKESLELTDSLFILLEYNSSVINGFKK